jgi:hypothetical protein
MTKPDTILIDGNAHSWRQLCELRRQQSDAWREAGGYSVAVVEDGPGVPVGFDPAGCKSLGMTIVLALVRQIGGVLKIGLVAMGGLPTRRTFVDSAGVFWCRVSG